MSDLTSGSSRGVIHDDSVAVAFKKAIAVPGKNRTIDMRVKKVELVVRCQELARFLRGFNEMNWPSWIDECVVEFRHDSGRGVAQLLEGYSGIGAIGDVYLCPEAGHRVSGRDEAAINEQFLLMLGKVNQLATEIANSLPRAR